MDGTTHGDTVVLGSHAERAGHWPTLDTGAGASRWTPLLAALIALVTFAVFSPALQNAFVEWDDEVLFTRNEHYRGLGWPQIQWMFTTVKMGHYVPITWLTHGLDYVLWGMDPAGYHFTNLLIHAAAAAVFYCVALRLLVAAHPFTSPARELAALAATLFFAVHPLRAESVAWVTERRDVLSGLFFFLTVLFYLQAREQQGAARARRHVAACACYLLAMLSKSMVMTLPAILILLDVYPFRRLGASPRTWLRADAWREKAPYIALGLLAAVLGYYAQAANAFITPATDIPVSARPAIVAYGLWFYVSKTFLPFNLSPLYELPPKISLFGPRFIGPTLGVLGMIVGLLLLRRRWPAGLAAFASYAILISPVVGIVHSGYQLTHDRYSYLSCVGWALLVGAGVGLVADVVRRGAIRPALTRALGIALAGWFAALAFLTWQQVQVWKDTSTLWEYALDAEPECTVCLYNHGALLYNLGKPALAVQRFEQIMAVRPDRARAQGNLGLAYVAVGDLPRAAQEYRSFLARIPDDVEAHNNLGVIWIALGRPRDAMFEFDFALRLQDNPVFRANLALALLDAGEIDRAVAEAERAVGQQPDLVQGRFALGLAHRRRGDLRRAMHQQEILRRLDPRIAGQLGSWLLETW